MVSTRSLYGPRMARSVLCLCSFWLILILLSAHHSAIVCGAEESVSQSTQEAKAPVPRRWGLILVGVPGDDAHTAQFRATADVWRRWCEEILQVPAERMRIRTLVAPDAPEALPPLTRDGLTEVCRDLAAHVAADDELWVMTLGHGMARPKWAAFHVTGLDITDEVLSKELSTISCRQQIVWLTHAGSGQWLRRMANPHRLVVAATSDDENNETEFPHALATVFSRYFANPAANVEKDRANSEPTADNANEASVESLPENLAELFEATRHEVGRRYTNDKRVPTEHAQLDDNGDGRGTEVLADDGAEDGKRARQCVIRVE